ncbi:luciferin 4-monooxygenase-like [Euwallacea similis]|uniref:luciferin 4-monooxygenase-like n=1 Tax=Euwallacea similis TaxID=1736056 RepID=UPI00344B1222
MSAADNKNIQEDDTYVIRGPRLPVRVSQELVGKEILNALLNAPKNEAAMIDAFTGEKLLFSELLQRSVNLARALQTLNHKGQKAVIAICSENCLDYFIPMIAALLNGSITVPVSHFYMAQELEHVFNISTPNLIFCSKETLEKVLLLKNNKLSFIVRVILLGKKPLNSDGPNNEVTYLNEFVDNALKGRSVSPNSFRPARGNVKNTVALIMNSSGTTGLPKGVALSHQCLNVRIAQAKENFSNITTSENFLGLMPFYHSFGNLLAFSILLNGKTLVVLKRFDEDVFLKTIQEYKIKYLSVSPPVVLFLAKSDKVLKYDLSCVKSVRSGAAHLSKDLEEALASRLKGVITSQGYGLTEMTLVVTSVPLDKPRPGSCGKLMSFISGKVRDPQTGRSLGPNEVGEFCWKGATLMMGYYKNEQATKECFTSDGWLRSGDLGYYDEDEYFYIVDRMKEIIKYKGFQVSPAELEAILINHPKISDAAVIGLPNKLCGELPLAFVVKEREDLSEVEVQEYVKGLLSPHKHLRGGVIFVESIPRNPTGKIVRRELKKMLQNVYKSKL